MAISEASSIATIIAGMKDAGLTVPNKARGTFGRKADYLMYLKNALAVAQQESASADAATTTAPLPQKPLSPKDFDMEIPVVPATDNADDVPLPSGSASPRGEASSTTGSKRGFSPKENDGKHCYFPDRVCSANASTLQDRRRSPAPLVFDTYMTSHTQLTFPRHRNLRARKARKRTRWTMMLDILPWRLVAFVIPCNCSSLFYRTRVLLHIACYLLF